MWESLAVFILRNRIKILIFIAVITAGMAYVAKERVHLMYTLAQLLPDDDPTLKENTKFKEVFGAESTVMFVAIPTEKLYGDVELYKGWEELRQRLSNVRLKRKVKEDGKKVWKDINPIDSTFSETHLFFLETDDSAQKFVFSPLDRGEEITTTLMQQRKDFVRSQPFFKNLLYSEPEEGASGQELTLLLVFFKSEIFNDKIRGDLMELVKEEVTWFNETYGETYVSGLPFIRTEVSGRIKAEMNVFVIMAIVVTSLILFLFFRNWVVVVFSLLVVGVGVAWSMGTIGIFGYEISGLMALIPPLIIVIGIPNCVYLINKYQAEYRTHKNKARALKSVVTKIGTATFMTNMTTSLGFATFIFTQSSILVEFGVIAAINIVLVFVLSILIIPTVFSFLPPPNSSHVKHLDRKWTNSFMQVLVNIVKGHRTKVYWVAFAIVIVGLVGLFQMKVTGTFTDDIPEKDKVNTDLRVLESSFNGLMPFEIMITTPSGKFTSMKRIKKIAEIQDSLAHIKELSSSLSLVNALKYTRQAFYKNEAVYFDLPSNSEMSLMEPYFKNTFDKKSEKGENILGQFIDSTEKITRITVNVKDIPTGTMDTLRSKVNKIVHGILNPKKALYDSLKLDLVSADDSLRSGALAYIKAKERKIARKIPEERINNPEAYIEALDNSEYGVVLTGSSVIYLEGTKYLVTNLGISLFLAVLVISFLMAFLFRSFAMVLVSLIPNLIPLVVTAALMGYFQIPLKPSTILVFSIAFGISVDDTIHFLAKYRQESKGKFTSISDAVYGAIKETGVSMLYTSIILYFGFSIFMTSNFGGTFALGMLVSITLLVAMFSNLIILPSLLLTLEKRINVKAFNEPYLDSYNEEIDIELDDLKVQK